MHEYPNRNQHPTFPRGPATRSDEDGNHEHRSEKERMGQKPRRLPRRPHCDSDGYVDQIRQHSANCQVAEIHCFITERVAYERDGGADVPEEHPSANQDGPTMDAPRRILLLCPDHLGG